MSGILSAVGALLNSLATGMNTDTLALMLGANPFAAQGISNDVGSGLLLFMNATLLPAIGTPGGIADVLGAVGAYLVAPSGFIASILALL